MSGSIFVVYRLSSVVSMIQGILLLNLAVSLLNLAVSRPASVAKSSDWRAKNVKHPLRVGAKLEVLGDGRLPATGLQPPLAQVQMDMNLYESLRISRRHFGAGLQTS